MRARLVRAWRQCEFRRACSYLCTMPCIGHLFPAIYRVVAYRKFKCTCCSHLLQLLLSLNTLTPLDTPAVVLIATEDRVHQALYRIDSDGHELWPLRRNLALDISGASTLDVDVMENNIFWVNKIKKVRRVMCFEVP